MRVWFFFCLSALCPFYLVLVCLFVWLLVLLVLASPSSVKLLCGVFETTRRRQEGAVHLVMPISFFCFLSPSLSLSPFFSPWFFSLSLSLFASLLFHSSPRYVDNRISTIFNVMLTQFVFSACRNVGKKRRFHWTQELHALFERAVQHLNDTGASCV